MSVFLLSKQRSSWEMGETNSPLHYKLIKNIPLSFFFLLAGTQKMDMGSAMESWKETLNSTDARLVLYKKKEFSA